MVDLATKPLTPISTGLVCAGQPRSLETYLWAYFSHCSQKSSLSVKTRELIIKVSGNKLSITVSLVLVTDFSQTVLIDWISPLWLRVKRFCLQVELDVMGGIYADGWEKSFYCWVWLGPTTWQHPQIPCSHCKHSTADQRFSLLTDRD